MSYPNPVEKNSIIGATAAERWRVDGKFFAAGDCRISIRGVTYGPFPPGQGDVLFPDSTQVERDFELVRDLGGNVLRCYTVPPEWVFDLAQQHELKLFVDIPWNYQLAFLDEARHSAEALRAVRDFASRYAGHPALFAVCVANEIPPDIVRWSGAGRIGDFLDQLIGELKAVDESILATFCGYPSTEYLVVREIDFMCFNVYLHDPDAFSGYLARLQTIAGPKPLVLGELGFDSLRTDEFRQAHHLEWQLKVASEESVAGTFVYSFCDEWYKDGRLVEDWAFGLLKRDRTKKASFASVREAYQCDSVVRRPESEVSLISVVVAVFNAESTIVACIESLQRLHYPAFEIIVVDDGSTDQTPNLIGHFDGIRVVRHDINQGLSAARNAGILASSGEIVAFTDADCQVDAAWLSYLSLTLEEHEFKGVGGHNLLPEEMPRAAAAVGVAPGGPIHVMLTDRVAEHIPGCNMAFYRSVLDEVGGFDVRFRAAGDDVDLCWRIQQNGHRIGFSPGGFVWHDRRTSISGYVKQQMGYGKAEALLAQKFPSLFNWLGDHMWQGRIYDESAWLAGLSGQLIYRGIYGRGLFQMIPFGRSSLWTVIPLSLEFHVLWGGGTLILGLWNGYFLILTGLGLVASFAICYRAACGVHLPRRHRSWMTRFLVGWLYFLQPVVRGFARYRAQWSLPSRKDPSGSLGARNARGWLRWTEIRKRFWAENEGERLQLISGLHERLSRRGWPTALDDGYQDFDISAQVGVWGRIEFLSAEEFFPENRRQVRTRLRFKWSRTAQVILLLTSIGCGTGLSWGPGNGLLAGVYVVPLLVLLAWLFRLVRGDLDQAEQLVNEAALSLGLLDVESEGERAVKHE